MRAGTITDKEEEGSEEIHGLPWDESAMLSQVSMNEYTERLEVRLRPETYRLLKEYAYTRGVSMGHLVREALEQQYGAHSGKVDSDKQRAMERLFETDAPVADWPDMKMEIEKGATSGKVRD